jgi:hypothetical protein
MSQVHLSRYVRRLPQEPPVYTDLIVSNVVRFVQKRDSSITQGICGIGLSREGELLVADKAVSDGDTVRLGMIGNIPARLIGIDTAEKAFALPIRPTRPKYTGRYYIDDAYWDEYLSDPFKTEYNYMANRVDAPVVPLESFALAPELHDHLARRQCFRPGTGKNHRLHAEQASAGLLKMVIEDLAHLNKTEEDVQFFFAFSYEIMDSYGRFLCILKPNEPSPNPSKPNFRQVDPQNNGMVELDQVRFRSPQALTTVDVGGKPALQLGPNTLVMELMKEGMTKIILEFAGLQQSASVRSLDETGQTLVLDSADTENAEIIIDADNVRRLEISDHNVDAVLRSITVYYRFPGTRLLSYNLRMLQKGYSLPYFIWPNIDPWSKESLKSRAVVKPDQVRQVAETGTLGQARKLAKEAREAGIGVWGEPTGADAESGGPLRVLPFELRYLARRRGPDRYVIDLSKDSNQLLPPHLYFTIPNPEDRLYIPEEYVPLFLNPIHDSRPAMRWQLAVNP